MAITLVFILLLSFTERFRDSNNNRIAQHNHNYGQQTITTKQQIHQTLQPFNSTSRPLALRQGGPAKVIDGRVQGPDRSHVRPSSTSEGRSRCSSVVTEARPNSSSAASEGQPSHWSAASKGQPKSSSAVIENFGRTPRLRKAKAGRASHLPQTRAGQTHHLPQLLVR